MGEVGDASNFKEAVKVGAVGLQFAHAVFLFLGGFAWNDLFS